MTGLPPSPGSDTGQIRLPLALPRRRPRPIRDFFHESFGVQELTFAAFLSAGHLKADSRLAWVPGDLTVILAAVTLVFVLASAKRMRGWAKPLGRMLLLFAFFLPGLVLLETWSEYSIIKSQRFFTLTLLAATAPFFLLTDRRSTRKFLNSLALFGGIIGLDAIANLAFADQTVRLAINRLTADASNTIALGRTSAFALLWVLVLWIEKRIKPGVAMATGAVLGFALVGSGSRGPVLAALLAFLIMLMVFGRRVSKMRSRAALGAIAALSVVMLFQPIVPSQSFTRLEGFFQGDVDQQRSLMYQVGVPAIPTTPLGVGLGGYANQEDLGAGIDSTYPHNTLVEAGLEGGWFALGYLVYLLVQSLKMSAAVGREERNAPEVRILFAGIVFTFVAALASGDFNDNRLMFALIATGLSPAALASPVIDPRRDTVRSRYQNRQPTSPNAAIDPEDPADEWPPRRPGQESPYA